MNTGRNKSADAANVTDTLRLDWARRHREFDECRKRMEQMEGVFAHVADAIFVAAPYGRIIDVNPAASALLGYSKEELLAMHPWGFVTSASREEILKMARSLGPRAPVTVQRTCLTKNGQQLVVDLGLTRCALGGHDLIIATCRDVTEQQQARADLERALAEIRNSEIRLRRSEAYLAEAQKLSHTGSIFWRPSTGEIRWSEETYRIYEYSPEVKPTMQLVRQRVHPDDRALFDETARQAPQKGEDLEFERRLLMPSGAVKHIRFVSRVTRDGTGELEFNGVVMDVTEQHLAQKSLESAFQEMQALKDQFQQAIDTIPGLVWSSLPDGYIDFLNQRWREYTGLTLEQARGWGWRAAIHPDDLPGLESYWRSVLASGKPGETEVRLRRFDGVYRWFLFRGVPLYDGSGKLIKWYGQTNDIDARIQAEQKLRQSEAYLAEAQRLSRTGSFGWNVATEELVWSDETFCIVGYDRTIKPTLELVFKRIHPEDIAFVQQTLDRATRDETNLDFEHRLLMPDGLVKHVHVLAQPAKTGAGALEFVGAVMDITERKQAAEELRASEHLARGQLAALTHTLDSLSQESDPDKLPKHVVTTILTQMGAHSEAVEET